MTTLVVRNEKTLGISVLKFLFFYLIFYEFYGKTFFERNIRQ